MGAKMGHPLLQRVLRLNRNSEKCLPAHPFEIAYYSTPTADAKTGLPDCEFTVDSTTCTASSALVLELFSLRNGYRYSCRR